MEMEILRRAWTLLRKQVLSNLPCSVLLLVHSLPCSILLQEAEGKNGRKIGGGLRDAERREEDELWVVACGEGEKG